MDLPKRKQMRLKEYDYSSDGYYFVTICTAEKKKTLGDIVGQELAPAEIKLSKLGTIVEEQLLNTSSRFETVKVDKYVIMPNHIHIIYKIANANGVNNHTISDVVRVFKSTVSVTYKRVCKVDKVWQDSFYDHIIRDEDDYFNICQYIENNPQKWTEDKYFIV